ncbi:MAG: tetratricopeptide repeat protein [Candidatus Aminicenantes bacterium]|nr:tetratricopeptide repeat protein [Candidatus Aminicenantes bacterium]
MKISSKMIIILFSFSLLLSQCASPQKKIDQQREKDPKYQYNLGLFYLNNNDIDRAIVHLNRTLTLEPRHYLAYNALGLALSMKGQLQEALKAYIRCLEINPSFSEARNNLGSLYQELGYLDKAEEEFKKALTDPGYQSKELPAYNLARLYFLKENFEEALALVNNALRFNSRLAMAHNLKGLILQKLNRLTEAIECFNQAIKLVPDDVTFNFNLAVAYFNDSQLLKAREILERIFPFVRDESLKQQIAYYLKIINEKLTYKI